MGNIKYAAHSKIKKRIYYLDTSFTVNAFWDIASKHRN